MKIHNRYFILKVKMSRKKPQVWICGHVDNIYIHKTEWDNWMGKTRWRKNGLVDLDKIWDNYDAIMIILVIIIILEIIPLVQQE